ncbi:PIN domain-containing protein [Pseudomonas syringae pv. aptata]|uniref:PIN domain-containing protein n=1 Tax=Pseudomonas syringae TaxID=317 RepID=UPI000BB5B864|nr:PIN domain-containing protein [Pseudomonas syringae]MCK0545816.1 PIN domain-containing protein [Pseudomonas syringae pv. aptata]PBP87566.1 PIN domain-containing protein [Pseudomonas syringae]
MFLDIKDHEPSKESVFFVDTNVWYWTTYAASKKFFGNTAPRDYQMEFYPAFIEKVLANDATLHYTCLTLVELTSLIERSEFEIFKAFNGDKKSSLKQFRKDSAQRNAVLAEIESAWEQIQSMASELPTLLPKGTSAELVGIVHAHTVDGYDALYIKLMRDHKIENIITDDKDFKGVHDLNLYSCYPA